MLPVGQAGRLKAAELHMPCWPVGVDGCCIMPCAEPRGPACAPEPAAAFATGPRAGAAAGAGVGVGGAGTGAGASSVGRPEWIPPADSS